MFFIKRKKDRLMKTNLSLCYRHFNVWKQSLQFILVACFIACTVTTTASPTPSCSLKFVDGSLAEAISLANSDNKFLFLHITSQGCSPCQVLSKTLCSDANVANFYNEHFVNYMLDLDKREHNSFARIHNLSNEPALFYLNSGGQIVKRGATPPNTEELIVMAEEALELKTRIEEKYNLEAMKDKYKHHFDSPDFLYDFAYMLKAYGEPHNTVVNQYLSTQTQNSLAHEKNRAFVYDFANSLENEAIDYFLNDIGHYKELIGGREINDKIKIAIYNSIIVAIKERDTNLFNKAMQVIADAHLHNSEAFSFYIKIAYFEGIKDWDNYSKETIKYFDTFNITDAELLHDAAEKFFLYQDNKKRLNQAIEWIKLSIQIDESYLNNLTHARLMKKAGNCDAAKAAAVKAIEIANIRNEEATEAEKLIDTIDSRGCKQPKP